MDFAQMGSRLWRQLGGGIYGVSKPTGNQPPTTAYYWGRQDAGATQPPFTTLLLDVVLKSTILCTGLMLLKARNFLYPARTHSRCTMY